MTSKTFKALVASSLLFGAAGCQLPTVADRVEAEAVVWDSYDSRRTAPLVEWVTQLECQDGTGFKGPDGLCTRGWTDFGVIPVVCHVALDGRPSASSLAHEMKSAALFYSGLLGKEEVDADGQVAKANRTLAERGL